LIVSALRAIVLAMLMGGLPRMAAAGGRVASQAARGVGAGGVALVQEVIAVVGSDSGLAAGLPQPAARSAAAPGGPAGAGQQQAQPEHGDGHGHDAVEEQRPAEPVTW